MKAKNEESKSIKNGNLFNTEYMDNDWDLVNKEDYKNVDVNLNSGDINLSQDGLINNDHNLSNDDNVEASPAPQENEPHAGPGNDSGAQSQAPVGRPNKYAQIENFLSSCGIQFRFNIITGRVESNFNSTGELKPLDEKQENSILRKIRAADLKCGPNDLVKILCSDFIKEFNPFDDYLNSLPEWDGETDFINQLAQTVKTGNDEIFYRYFKKWIVASVGCMIDEDEINHTALVFSGKQGIGKTTFFNNLVPKKLQTYVYSGFVNPTDKDAAINLSECFLIILDELESLSNNQIGSLKEIMTRKHNRVRRPYDRRAENYTRRSSFCGSINNEQFLTDTTGNRRFLCFKAESFDLNHEIDINMVYAQALSLYSSGEFNCRFNQMEIEELNAHNAQFVVTSFEEDLLLDYFEACTRANATHTLKTSDVAQFLAVNKRFVVNINSIKKLGAALQKHGFERFKQRERYVYALKLKPNNQPDES